MVSLRICQMQISKLLRAMSEVFSNVKAYPFDDSSRLGFDDESSLFADGFQEGVHYRLLTKPVVTSDPSRVEVLELFWYGYPHCDTLDPALKAWAQNYQAMYCSRECPLCLGVLGKCMRGCSGSRRIWDFWRRSTSHYLMRFIVRGAFTARGRCRCIFRAIWGGSCGRETRACWICDGECVASR